MATTTFTDQQTVIEASWLNDTDDIVYSLSLTTNGNGASRIGVEDSAGNFASTTVEAVLAEIISDYAAVTNGNGASKVGVEDSAANFSATTVEAVLAEIISDLAATTSSNGASLIGIQDTASQIAATTVETALAEIVDTAQAHVVTMASTSNGDGSSLVGVEDASSYWTGTDVEAVLDEIGQHIVSVQKFISIPLNTFRETTNFDVGDIAANGGILASDTTPVLDAINAATDGCQRILWASSDVTQIVFQTSLPPDFDTSANLVLHTRIVSGGTANAVGFTVDSFFNEGDSKVTDTSGTNQTTTYTEVTTTIALADIPSGAQTVTIGLTPVSHGTDTLALSAAWFEYSGLLRTS